MFGSVFLFAFTAGHALAGYAGSSSNSGNNVGEGRSAGTGYGYSGSYSGSFPPNFPQFPQFDFSGFLNGYLDALSKYQQQFVNNGGGPFSYSYTSSSPNSRAHGKSSITYHRIPQPTPNQYNGGAQQGGYGYAGGFPAASGFGGGFGSGGAFGGSFTYPNAGAFPSGAGAGSYAPSGGGAGGNYGGYGGYGGSDFGPGSGAASAVAAIGPQGVYQSANVYPENPNSPNINNRFGETQQGGQAGGKPGHYSVFTSSSSHSSNVNGKPESSHQAQTTVNDNGKITTFTAKNP